MAWLDVMLEEGPWLAHPALGFERVFDRVTELEHLAFLESGPEQRLVRWYELMLHHCPRVWLGWRMKYSLLDGPSLGVVHSIERLSNEAFHVSRRRVVAGQGLNILAAELEKRTPRLDDIQVSNPPALVRLADTLKSGLGLGENSVSQRGDLLERSKEGLMRSRRLCPDLDFSRTLLSVRLG